jgi:voltage-gated potassium channel
MRNETRVERWLDRLIARAQSPRTAAIVIASVTSSMTVAAGVAMTFVDEKSFPSVSSGLWWAVQTVTTVGYGDHVPADAAGKVLAAVVMLLGIGFVTVITAAITSAFVAREDDSGGPDGPTAEQLRRIDERLERIEAALRQTRTGG